eukprot:TRINITY_DN769_c0_g1_i1.p1 TRINITY_DN769_c0_g1~~TRINITY_DN769_c0_g1_i1.p1  ORF type:complete len:168 (+),score=22.48 TRINITY_DN769_c0_g1_i1:359-862(+)
MMMTVCRDLNTKNVLLDEHYHCKISDFGLSRLRAEEGYHMTQNVGFLACMAPEVFKGEEYSFHADVFSFAILLFNMVSGEKANNGTEPLKFAHMVAHDNYRPIIPDVVSPFYKELITQCWNAKPDQRPSFSAVLEHLVSNPEAGRIHLGSNNEYPSSFDEEEIMYIT